jgi:hypothetical protein
MKSHRQLVEEWKGKVDEEFLELLPRVFDRAAVKYLVARAMFAAAKGATEAGKVRQGAGHWEMDGEYCIECQRNHSELDHHSSWNAAISQSERQLTDYFKDV